MRGRIIRNSGLSGFFGKGGMEEWEWRNWTVCSEAPFPVMSLEKEFLVAGERAKGVERNGHECGVRQVGRRRKMGKRFWKNLRFRKVWIFRGGNDDSFCRVRGRMHGVAETEGRDG